MIVEFLDVGFINLSLDFPKLFFDYDSLGIVIVRLFFWMAKLISVYNTLKMLEKFMELVLVLFARKYFKEKLWYLSYKNGALLSTHFESKNTWNTGYYERFSSK